MNYKNYNDYELIYMVRENDQNSYDILLDKYDSLIKKIAYEYYVKFSSYGHELDDFVQVALMAFYKALRTFDERKNVLFYTYVLYCIDKKLISFSRCISSGKKNIPVEYTVDFDKCDIADKNTNIEDELIINEMYKYIKDFLYDIDFIDACILELKINNFSIVDISSLLDIPNRTIQFKSYKLRKILKKRMSNLL